VPATDAAAITRTAREATSKAKVVAVATKVIDPTQPPEGVLRGTTSRGGQ
jgi:hypothetical protein